MPLPWFPLVADDVLRDAYELPAAARAADYTLQAASWKWGPLAIDKLHEFAHVSRREWPGIWSKIRHRWQEQGDIPNVTVVCPKLETYRERADRTQQAAKSAAAASVAVRRGKVAKSHETGSTDVEPPLNGRSTDAQRTLNGRSSEQSAGVERTPNDRDRDREEDKEEKKIPASASLQPDSRPSGHEPAGPKRLGGQDGFNLTSPASGAAKEGKTKKPPSEPLPIDKEEALRLIADADTSRRFLMPDGKIAKDHVFPLQKLIREYPDPAQWTALGAWFGAGGAEKMADIPFPILLTAMRGWMPHVKLWSERGRPAIWTRPRDGNGHAVPGRFGGDKPRQGLPETPLAEIQARQAAAAARSGPPPPEYFAAQEELDAMLAEREAADREAAERRRGAR